ncbi:MAG: hypothetical protein D6791_00100 [Chloroflexi bacterium]|nr:MAG: hypothetical protein D6791_00100 [Chloroflexota bacterium]
MPTQDYQTVWTAYQDAVANLYARPVAAMAERGEGDIARVTDLADRAQAVVDSSAALGQAAAQGLAAADAGQRELAELQLLAAAAYDLAIANDLVRLAEDGVPDDVVERGPTLPAAMSELQAILSASPEAGIQGLMEAELAAERTAGPSDPQAAKEALREAVAGALTDIRDDAASAGQAALVGLLEIPAPPIRNAATVVVHELLTKLSEGVSVLLRKAANLVVQAIDKILTAMGKEAQDEARKKAAEWIEELKAGTLFSALLDKLYQPERIQEEVQKQLDQAPDSLGADAFNTASQQVAELATKFRKQKETITWLTRGLAWARAWLIGIDPWGPLALTTAYVAAIGYIVYAGGDYIDWFRTGASERLNFVPGVRTVVKQALNTNVG